MQQKYQGNPENRRAAPWRFEVGDPDPRLYMPDARLVDAVNVALLLRRPLLLAGEPGTGKTELAMSLAWELDLDKPLIFETKSTSVARDLFYNYDAVGHFRLAKDEQSKGKTVLDFLQWNALGEAIIRSKSAKEVQEFFGREFSDFGGYDQRHVVLIDEIDKAPRDFPNDLLNEVERKFFRVPEWKNDRVVANPLNAPIVVLTSNSEKNLPDPFLRRCAFYHINFPNEERLTAIVASRLPQFGQRREGGLIQEVIELFLALREKPEQKLDKKPATAELIDWLLTLQHVEAQPDRSIGDQPERVLATVAAISKSERDQEYIGRLIDGGDWRRLIVSWKDWREKKRA